MSNQYFTYGPEYSTWEDFNGNLIIAYGYEPIPFNTQKDWMQTAKYLAQLPSFALYPVPNPEPFQNWQEWAKEFALIINGPK